MPGLNRVRTILLSFAVFLPLCLTSASFAASQYLQYLPYPSGDSVVLNPYEALDESALLLNALQEHYRKATGGRRLEVQSMPGRGGADAWGFLAQQQPSGYTIGLIEVDSFVLRALAPFPAYRLEELVSVAIVGEIPLMLWVPEASPYKTLADLVASASRYPEQVYITGGGTNSSVHLAAKKFDRFAGVKTLYLPRLGSASAVDAVLQGQAHAAWAYASLQQGMRPLAVAGTKRHFLYPDVPTFEELNIALVESARFGIAMPAGTPQSTLQKAGEIFYAIAASESFQQDIAGRGFYPFAMGLFDSVKLINNAVPALGLDMDDYGLR